MPTRSKIENEDEDDDEDDWRGAYTALNTNDLTLAGFDFRVTKDGRWYCLEVNPMPTFLPYETATGQPIGNAVLDALLAQIISRAA